ncbi:hypothetical protein ARAM_006189 [Aspergillus rambellii]|uniref:TECPR1-like DysF domain-containing protein n=1 Tax=Aspergillus rambellii TaxID=308745 RepID=A0A0F8X0K6_9EURO|nr:hypothetical protein ARAM_006189 [Aspergillus rambellii]
MDETTTDASADRDDLPLSPLGKQSGNIEGLDFRRHGRSGSVSSMSSIRRSVQDTLLTKILQQVIPDDVDDDAMSVTSKAALSDAKRPAFSLPDRDCFPPSDPDRAPAQLEASIPHFLLPLRLFLCLPRSSLSRRNSHCDCPSIRYGARLPCPTPSAALHFDIQHYPILLLPGSCAAPAKTIKPAPETSKDFFRNMRDLQNCMADFSDLHDSAVSAVAPLTNFSNEELSSTVFLLCMLLTAGLFITSHLIPWRYILLVSGNAAILSKHPNIHDFIQNIAHDMAKEAAGQVPPLASASPEVPLTRLLGDISLDSFPEEREVEIFEIQYRSLAPYSESDWESFLFSPVPYDPLSPSRIAGDRPKGCRFFEDVQPPAGWAWKSKKWELDLDCREWVVERMITGVGFEVPGAPSQGGPGTDEIGGWVWDLSSPSSPRGDDGVASALGYQDFGSNPSLCGDKKKSRKKGKEKASQDYEEKGNTGPNVMGEWRRRRWVRIVNRIGMSAGKEREKDRVVDDNA